MAGLMVVELQHREKRILTQNLNSAQSMAETSPQRIVFPPSAFSRATVRHQIIGPNLYLQAQTCRGTWLRFLVGLHRMPYRVKTLVEQPPCIGNLGMGIAKRVFGIPETIKEEVCDEKVVEHTQSLWPVDDERRMPEHAASYERRGESRHGAEIRNSAGFDA